MNRGGAEPPVPNLLQSPLWGRFKSEFGWSHAVARASQGPWSGHSISVLQRNLAPGLSLVYVPYAPPYATSEPDAANALVALADELSEAFVPAGSASPVCVRFDLLWPRGTVGSTPTRRLKPAVADVQPSSTVLLDLRQSEDQLLAGMHKKNRYNIGLAGRKGVSVRASDRSGLEAWYRLYRETAKRDRITIHPVWYYEHLFGLAALDPTVDLTLYLAYKDEELLAGIIVARFSGVATYLYGASSNAGRNLMPNYALQWKAITDARTAGAQHYDLFGIPPEDDPDHPMHGLYRFKTGFGGKILHRAGSWDVVTAPVRYHAYRAAERARVYYFHRVRKRAR